MLVHGAFNVIQLSKIIGIPSHMINNPSVGGFMRLFDQAKQLILVYFVKFVVDRKRWTICKVDLRY